MATILNANTFMHYKNALLGFLLQSGIIGDVDALVPGHGEVLSSSAGSLAQTV